jgi:hypothetical protein
MVHNKARFPAGSSEDASSTFISAVRRSPDRFFQACRTPITGVF